MEFQNEVPLSKEPLRMDVLIIKKEKNTVIEKDIGRIFRGHNIIEYKSELDYVSIDDFFKICGYAMLYKAFTSADASDITITFVETHYPEKLFKYLNSNKSFTITEAYEGVYYIEGNIFPIQIIESKKLSKQDNLLLKNLRSDLAANDLIEVLNGLKSKGMIDIDNAYTFNLIEANRNALKEVLNMNISEVDLLLKEAAEKKGFFDEAISFGIKRGREEGLEKGLEKGREEGIEKGMERGIEEGFTQGLIKVAKTMLMYNEPIEKIMSITDLPLEKIYSLKAQI